jgi:hypothetical protein
MSPVNIIIVGAIFIISGIIIILFLIGLIHIMVAPVHTAIIESFTMGLLIFISSLKEIHGVEFKGDIIVDMVNRME